MQELWLVIYQPLFDPLQNPEYQIWSLEHEDPNRTSSTQIGPKNEKSYSLKSRLGWNLNSYVANHVGKIKVLSCTVDPDTVFVIVQILT